MAPEVLLNQEYSFKVDVFALSLVMFKMLEGRHPFFVKGITNQYYIKLLTSTEPTPALKWSNECLSLFRRISRVDPLYRYTAAEALTHPWFTGQPLHVAPLSSQEALDFQEVSQQLSRDFWQLMITADADLNDEAYSLKAARFVRRENEGEVKMTLKHLDELLGPYDYLACKQQKATTWINDSHPKIMQLHEIYDNILYRKPALSAHERKDKDKPKEKYL